MQWNLIGRRRVGSRWAPTGNCTCWRLKYANQQMSIAAAAAAAAAAAESWKSWWSMRWCCVGVQDATGWRRWVSLVRRCTISMSSTCRVLAQRRLRPFSLSLSLSLSLSPSLAFLKSYFFFISLLLFDYYYLIIWLIIWFITWFY